MSALESGPRNSRARFQLGGGVVPLGRHENAAERLFIEAREHPPVARDEIRVDVPGTCDHAFLLDGRVAPLKRPPVRATAVGMLWR